MKAEPFLTPLGFLAPVAPTTLAPEPAGTVLGATDGFQTVMTRALAEPSGSRIISPDIDHPKTLPDRPQTTPENPVPNPTFTSSYAPRHEGKNSVNNGLSHLDEPDEIGRAGSLISQGTHAPGAKSIKPPAPGSKSSSRSASNSKPAAATCPKEPVIPSHEVGAKNLSDQPETVPKGIAPRPTSVFLNAPGPEARKSLISPSNPLPPPVPALAGPSGPVASKSAEDKRAAETDSPATKAQASSQAH